MYNLYLPRYWCVFFNNKTVLQSFYGFSFKKMGQKNSKNETLNLNEIAQLETEDVFKKDRW